MSHQVFELVDRILFDVGQVLLQVDRICVLVLLVRDVPVASEEIGPREFPAKSDAHALHLLFHILDVDDAVFFDAEVGVFETGIGQVEAFESVVDGPQYLLFLEQHAFQTPGALNHDSLSLNEVYDSGVDGFDLVCDVDLL
eukprot:CAMPEP_0197536846 /NCGR_PEP_ID=MMETSP1318-20131121/55043_1 /TAXON_ID=552666 /ORGANISM="Partenskyella glossopodia, Strain RCC365" /LENGTH=140 /DNA_ID=CAMNT_0043094851 /DNA_START=128 /DNA_END=546 /DNA_ORIENTATION=-